MQRFLHVDGDETHRPAGLAPRGDRKIGRDDGRDFRVAARRLVVHHEHDRPARAGNLNRSADDPVGNDVVAFGVRERGTFETVAHAVGLRRYRVFGRQEGLDSLLREIVGLRTEDDADRLVEREVERA